MLKTKRFGKLACMSIFSACGYLYTQNLKTQNSKTNLVTFEEEQNWLTED